MALSADRLALIAAIAKVGGDTEGVGEAIAALALAKSPTLVPGAKATKLPGDSVGLAQRMRNVVLAIRGITPTTYFGPGQPLLPAAQPEEMGARGRRFDYQVSSNIQFIPKTESTEGVPFSVLRSLAESFDVLRLVIETRKDQIASFEWEFLPKDETADKDKFKDEIREATDFWEQPAPHLDWPDWVRMVSEDLFVCDGVAIFPTRNRRGGMFSLEPVDATTVKILVDETGRTPLPPNPAYQQVLKGLPAVDYSSDELLYWMRNPRTWRLYGLSPVEQVIVTVNIALRRQQYQLEYYTSGSVPDALIGVAADWTPTQIKDFQDQWDSEMAGVGAARRRLKFLPKWESLMTPKDSVVALADSFDEWLARVICFAFSIPPTAFVKMMNRASGEKMAETAKEEGLMPLMKWIGLKMTRITNLHLGLKNVRFAWKLAEELDPVQAAEIRKSDVSAGIVGVDEAREETGRAPIGVGNIVLTAAGPVPLRETIDGAKEKIENPPPPPPAFGAVPGLHVVPKPGEDKSKNANEPPPPGGGADDAGKYLGTAMRKAARRPSPKRHKVDHTLGRLEATVRATVERALRRNAGKVARQLVAAYRAKGLGKAAGDSIVDDLLSQIDANSVGVAVSDSLDDYWRDVFREAGLAAVAEVGIDQSEAIVSHLDQAAADYAKARGAELVGMRVLADGSVVVNPNAEWSISEGTRDLLRGITEQAVREGMSPSRFADAIRSSVAFGDSRATMIARTELAYAHVGGNLAGYQATGEVVGKRWLISADACEECQQLDGVVVGINDSFPNGGGDGPPLHPNCRCDIVPVLSE